MKKDLKKFHNRVADYYSEKLLEHGVSPRGVDWNGESSQVLRFSQLAKVIKQQSGFSVNDLGCGYGALYDYLDSNYKEVEYYGYDVSGDMIKAAKERFSGSRNVNFIAGAEPEQAADYGVASGIFNVRLKNNDTEWLEYIVETLNVLDRTSKKGFSFNCLTSYSDADKMRDYLYYAEPCYLFDLCKRQYSRHVSLLHDYGLYEFTILVSKTL